jgi:hypothetical protein
MYFFKTETISPKQTTNFVDITAKREEIVQQI